MSKRKNKPFSLKLTEPRYLNIKQEKIQLISCGSDGKCCENHLKKINECYAFSEESHQDKEYRQAIDILGRAYNETFEMKRESCTKCAELFRETILNSIQNMYVELRSMTTGFFKNKRYNDDYLYASKVLDYAKNNPDMPLKTAKSIDILLRLENEKAASNTLSTKKPVRIYPFI